MFTSQLLLFGLGGQEVIILALIVLLLFGGKKIPELMKGLGRGVKSFKDGMNEVDEAVNDVADKARETLKDSSAVVEDEKKQDE